MVAEGPFFISVQPRPPPPAREEERDCLSKVGCCHYRVRHLAIWTILIVGGIVAGCALPPIMRNARLEAAAAFVSNPDCITLECLETVRKVALRVLGGQ